MNADLAKFYIPHETSGLVENHLGHHGTTSSFYRLSIIQSSGVLPMGMQHLPSTLLEHNETVHDMHDT